MGLEQPGDLHRYFLAPLRRTLDLRQLRNVRRHRDREAAKQLDALRDGVHQLRLLLEVLVEQQVQRVERVAGHLPVMLLVQVAHGHRVRQRLVERVDAVVADLFGQPIGDAGDRSKLLDFASALVDNGACFLACPARGGLGALAWHQRSVERVACRAGQKLGLNITSIRPSAPGATDALRKIRSKRLPGCAWL